MSDPFANLPNTLDPIDEVLQAPTAQPVAPANGYTSPRFAEVCKKCRGTGTYHNLGPCFACKGQGGREYTTSPQQRAQAKVKRAAKKIQTAVNAMEAFKAEHPEVLAWIDSSRGTFPFAQAMYDAIVKYGHLTPNQLAACQRSVDRRKASQVEREVRIATAPTVDVTKIELAMSTAFANGLKSPKLRIAQFKFSKASEKSANPGAIYVKEGSEYLGKIAGGKFLCVRACDDTRRDAILAAAADPKAAAIAYGRQTGSCSCCGRELTDPVSIEKGIGPICETKFGW